MAEFGFRDTFSECFVDALNEKFPCIHATAEDFDDILGIAMEKFEEKRMKQLRDGIMSGEEPND